MDTFAMGNALMAGGAGLGGIAQMQFKDQINAANQAQRATLGALHDQAQKQVAQAKAQSDQQAAAAKAESQSQAEQAKAHLQAVHDANTARTAAQKDATRLSVAKIAAEARNRTTASRQAQMNLENAKSNLAASEKQLAQIQKQLAGASQAADPQGYAQLQQKFNATQQLVQHNKVALSKLGDPQPVSGANPEPGAFRVQAPQGLMSGTQPPAPQTPAPPTPQTAGQPQQTAMASPAAPGTQPVPTSSGTRVTGFGTAQQPYKPMNAADMASMPAGSYYINPSDSKVYRKN